MATYTGQLGKTPEEMLKSLGYVDPTQVQDILGSQEYGQYTIAPSYYGGQSTYRQATPEEIMQKLYDSYSGGNLLSQYKPRLGVTEGGGNITGDQKLPSGGTVTDWAGTVWTSSGDGTWSSVLGKSPKIPTAIDPTFQIPPGTTREFDPTTGEYVFRSQTGQVVPINTAMDTTPPATAPKNVEGVTIPQNPTVGQTWKDSNGVLWTWNGRDWTNEQNDSTTPGVMPLDTGANTADTGTGITTSNNQSMPPAGTIMKHADGTVTVADGTSKYDMARWSVAPQGTTASVGGGAGGGGYNITDNGPTQGAAKPGVLSATETDFDPTTGETVTKNYENNKLILDDTQNKYGVDPPQKPEYDVDPVKTVQDYMTQIFAAMGLGDSKTQADNTAKELEDLANKRDKEIQRENDNPWLTEGVRRERVNKINQKYESRIANKVDYLQLLNTNMDNMRQQAQFVATAAINMYNADRNYQLDVAKLAMDAEKLASNRNIKEVQGGLYDVDNEVWIVPPKADTTSGLTPAQINATVNSIAGAFDNEPIVREFNTISSYVNAYDEYGASATDDQARIYTFAKVMDPTGAVKEGEYKTVQEYSQALLKRYGINLKRIFTGAGVLSPEARTAMGATLATKLNSQRIMYNNLRNEYQRQMDDARAGRPRIITDYSKDYNSIDEINANPLLNVTDAVGGSVFGDIF